MRHVPHLLLSLTLLLAAAHAACADDAPVVTARGEALVVAGHPDAVDAGMAVLRDGGNAVDAAVAVSLALGVAEPYGSGLGGKLVLLYHQSATGRTFVVEALDQTPLALDVEAFRGLDRDARRNGLRAVAVPGLLAGLDEAHRRWGSGAIAWARLVEPAIALAERGFEVQRQAHEIFRLARSRLAADPEAARLYLPHGRVPAPGDRLANADLADSLRRIARDGAGALYGGPIGERLVAASRDAGGWFTLDDLKRYRPRVGPPLSATYRGHRVHTSPPPLTGGATLLVALRCLERMPPADDADPRSAERIDRAARVLRAIYPEINRRIGDVPTAGRAATELLSEATIAQFVDEAMATHQHALLTAATAVAALPVTDDEAEQEACTTHFVVVDAAGNVVSATQSIGSRFGAGVVVPGTGFLLNNTMSIIAVNSTSSPNFVAAGKRPRSTMTPTIITRDGAAVAALGAPGGQRIPTAVLQVTADLIDLRLSPASAVAQPRFHLRRPILRADPANAVDLESDAPQELDTLLASLGWQVTRHARSRHYFGPVNAAVRDGDGWVGVADRRRTNAAEAD